MLIHGVFDPLLPFTVLNIFTVHILPFVCTVLLRSSLIRFPCISGDFPLVEISVTERTTVFTFTMHTTVAISSLLFAASCLAQSQLPDLSPDEIKSEIVAVESQIASYVPGGIPSATAIAEDLASFVTSVTAQSEFNDAVSVLETAVPSSLVEAISANPEEVILSLATATSPPAWVEAIPTSVIDYLSSVGEEAVSLVQADLPTVDSTYYYGGAPYPTGTAAYPTGSGYALPTGGNSTAPTVATPATYTGAASSFRSSALAVAAGLVGAGFMYFA